MSTLFLMDYYVKVIMLYLPRISQFNFYFNNCSLRGYLGFNIEKGLDKCMVRMIKGLVRARYKAGSVRVMG